MADPLRHPFVTVRVRPEQVELAQLRLWELGATGLEERDETTLVRESVPGQVVVIAAFSAEIPVHLPDLSETEYTVCSPVHREQWG